MGEKPKINVKKTGKSQEPAFPTEPSPEPPKTTQNAVQEPRTQAEETDTSPLEPNGLRIEQIQWFDDHFYKVIAETGEELYFPSVTTVLGAAPNPYLARWRADVGNEEADRRLRTAGERGSRIHNAAFVMESGGVVVFNDFRNPAYSRQDLVDMEGKYPSMAVLENQEEMWQLVKYRRWIDAVGPKLISNEQMVASIEHRIAGTLDRIYEIEEGTYQVAGSKPLKLPGGLYVTDIKSSNAIDESYYLQIATYSKICGLPIVGGLIVHTNASTRSGIEGLTTHYRTAEEMEQDFETFLSIYKVWRWRNPKNTPTIFTFPSLLAMDIQL